MHFLAAFLGSFLAVLIFGPLVVWLMLRSLRKGRWKPPALEMDGERVDPLS